MKKFEVTMTILVVFFIGMMAVTMLGSVLLQNKDNQFRQKMLLRENQKLESEVEHYEFMFGKYADNISDEMLRDFYPQASNMDSLRNLLKEKYEIRLRTLNDGLCY